MPYLLQASQPQTALPAIPPMTQSRSLKKGFNATYPPSEVPFFELYPSVRRSQAEKASNLDISRQSATEVGNARKPERLGQQSGHSGHAGHSVSNENGSVCSRNR